MFEPEGAALASLVATHQRNADFENRRAQNLRTAGYLASADTSDRAAAECFEQAAVCEMALLFEQLSGAA